LKMSANYRSRRSFQLVYVAIFGALSIVMGNIRVSFPLGSPNLGSTPVSIAAVTSPGVLAFAVGIIKGLGVSLWTGQFLIEFPAGVGDGIMAFLTSRLSRKINPIYAVIAGQLTRYVFTSGMIALSLSLTKAPIFSTFLSVWLGMVPAITASVVANAALSGLAVAALKKFYPVLLEHHKVSKQTP